MEKSNNRKKGDWRLKAVMDERSSKQLEARLSLNALFYLTKSALEMVFSLKRTISYKYPLHFTLHPQQIQEQNR